MGLYLVLIRMVFERKGVKRVDPPCSAEIQNGKLDWGLPERFAIEIDVLALQVKVFYTVVHRPLLTETILTHLDLSVSKQVV